MSNSRSTTVFRAWEVRAFLSGAQDREEPASCGELGAHSGTLHYSRVLFDNPVSWSQAAQQGWLKPCRLFRALPRRTSQITPLLENARRRRVPLSQPTACRPTPIATTALPFVVRVDVEGVRELQLMA